MPATVAQDRPIWGLLAFLAGVVALVAVTLHISGAFVEPEKSAATMIGEIAAEIRESAKNALSGEPLPEKPQKTGQWDSHQFFMFAVPLLAALASILGAISLYRREAPTLPTIAISMGIGAFVMQYVFWLALVIGGICLLIAIVNNLDGILGS